ncbi:hypothetical protein GDO86_004455 [Hymenochirus boettgeri]|uniref:Uncharacterized protein n=1 Tax=Hymenochirus boettgeri TaxID=247094 RepID=A0A8T2KAN2_9PIPI|nr:hypothetical protein GDO86_004455 [Hymenochirus boettgeri]
MKRCAMFVSFLTKFWEAQPLWHRPMMTQRQRTLELRLFNRVPETKRSRPLCFLEDSTVEINLLCVFMLLTASKVVRWLTGNVNPVLQERSW